MELCEIYSSFKEIEIITSTKLKSGQSFRGTQVSQETNFCLCATVKTYFLLVSFSIGHPGFQGQKALDSS